MAFTAGADMVVEGKVVVVTGAGAGIGRDFAKAFAAHGAKVVVNDLARADDGAPAAERVAKEITELGGAAVASVESVAQWESAQRIVQAALDHFGRIDCVINNAGVTRDRMFFNMSVEEWRTVLDVHLNGSFFIARAAAPFFKNQASGCYVHMTSTSGLIGNVGQANYAAAKMGIVGLSKCIALDMAKFYVRSNCIAPWAWTAMTANIPANSPENVARIEKLKKMESSKIAPLAVFLASDAGAQVSGQIFGVRANEIYLFSQPRIVRTLHPALTAAAAEIGPAAAAFPTDIANPTDVASAFSDIVRRLGAVDVLINNAALGHLQSIEESDDRLLQEEVGTNLLGAIYCIRAAIPLMRSRGGGHIVSVTSESTRAPYPFLSVYAATKAAVETLSAGLRTELRGENIRVTILRSGRLSESGFNRHWPEARRVRYRELVQAHGFYAQSGEPISPQIAAQAIVDIIRMPLAANVDLLELRPA